MSFETSIGIVLILKRVLICVNLQRITLSFTGKWHHFKFDKKITVYGSTSAPLKSKTSVSFLVLISLDDRERAPRRKGGAAGQVPAGPGR